MPVNGDNWDWSKCECTAHPVLDHRASYVNGHFGDDKLAIEVRFRDQALTSTGGTTKLRVVVQKDVELKVDHKATYSSTTYAFDANKIPDYPFYTSTERPYKLLVAGATDDVIVTNDQHLAGLPVASDPTAMLMTTTMGKTLTLMDNSPGVRDSCIVTTCLHDTLMHVDVVPQKTYTAYVYRLSESDDDFENYCVDKNTSNIPYSPGDTDPYLLSDCATPIDSLPDPAAFECINRGADGTLDRFMEVGTSQYWRKPHLDLNLSPDSVSFSQSNMLYSLKVHPQRDTMGRYFCNSKPVVHPKKWNYDANGDGINDCRRSNVPSSFSIADLEQAINSTYSKVGVSFSMVDLGELLGNYEITVDKEMDVQESGAFHAYRTRSGFSNLVPNDSIEIFIVDVLQNRDPITGKKGESEGRGLQYKGEGISSVFLVPKYLKTVTSPHELGHSVFGLQHPDEENGVKYDGLDAFVKKDYKNFMTSGKITSREKNANKVRPRKYQWTKIHN